MMDISKGRWWDDPWQLTSGCMPVSPGCLHCWSADASYIRQFQANPKIREQYEGLTTKYNGVPTFNGTVRVHPDRLSIPLRRKKPTVYAVWNDLFHEYVTKHYDNFIREVFDTIRKTPQHTFLILTKRPENMAGFMKHRLAPDNVYFGLTVCNQAEADEKIPVFLKVPGKKFLSIEPMLGAIDLRGKLCHWTNPDGSGSWFSPVPGKVQKLLIDAVILGGETGPGARPMHPDWVRSVRDQCAAAGVNFFFKQWGEWLPVAGCYEERECSDMPGVIDGDWPLCEVEKYQGRNEIIAIERSGAIPHWERGNQWRIEHQPGLNAAWIVRVGRKAAGRLLDGRTHDDLPWRTA